MFKDISQINIARLGLKSYAKTNLSKVLKGKTIEVT